MAGWNSATVFLLVTIAVLDTAFAGIFGFASSAKSSDEEWSHYHDQTALEKKLESIERKCPQNSRVYYIGKSVQGRKLMAIEFSTTPGIHQARK